MQVTEQLMTLAQQLSEEATDKIKVAEKGVSSKTNIDLAKCLMATGHELIYIGQHLMVYSKKISTLHSANVKKKRQKATYVTPLQSESKSKDVLSEESSHNRPSCMSKPRKQKKQKRKYNCQICKKVFNSYDLFLQNLDDHSFVVYKCSKCSKICLNKTNFETHITSHTKGLYTCQQCGKRFKLRTSRYNHMKMHRIDMYNCPNLNCNSKCRSVSAFREHVKYGHLNKKNNKVHRMQFKVPTTY